MDENHSKMISKEDFANTMKELRMGIGEKELETIVRMFDVQNNETVNYEELMKAVIGQMSDKRKQLVDEAYKKLEAKGKGVVTLDIVEDGYCAEKHPEVLAKTKNEGEVISEFMDTFEQHCSFNVILNALYK